MPYVYYRFSAPEKSFLARGIASAAASDEALTLSLNEHFLTNHSVHAVRRYINPRAGLRGYSPCWWR